MVSGSCGASERKMLRRVLLESEAQDSVLASVAGEDYDDGAPSIQGKVGAVPVVHPGSLSGGGHYALLTFMRGSPTEQWSLTESIFSSVDVS